MKKLFIALIIFLPNLSNAQEKTKKEEKTNSTKVDAWSGATQYGNYTQQVKGNISGRIIHEKTKKPLEFATISLFNKKK